MQKKRLTGWMLAVTAAAVLAMVLLPRSGEQAVQARMVTVSRGDVAQVAPLTGRITFLEETLVYAAAPGMVAEVLVGEGERVAEGQALLRLETDGVDRIVSAWLAAGEQLDGTAENAALLMDATVVRAPVNATVRQILTARSAAVAAGEPVMLLSSTQQAVICTVAEADARQVRPGMLVTLSIDGTQVGSAQVTQVSDMTADTLTGRVVCTVTLIPDAHLELPAGTAVDADVLIAGRENVTILPVEAVTERGTVWWVSEGRCTEIPAEIVLSDEMNVWVSLPEGLAVAVGEFEEGQRVVEVEP